MAEVLLTENPYYPGIAVNDDIEIYQDDETNCIIVKDKDTAEVLATVPCHYGPE